MPHLVALTFGRHSWNLIFVLISVLTKYSPRAILSTTYRLIVCFLFVLENYFKLIFELHKNFNLLIFRNCFIEKECFIFNIS